MSSLPSDYRTEANMKTLLCVAFAVACVFVLGEFYFLYYYYYYYATQSTHLCRNYISVGYRLKIKIKVELDRLQESILYDVNPFFTNLTTNN